MHPLQRMLSFKSKIHSAEKQLEIARAAKLHGVAELCMMLACSEGHTINICSLSGQDLGTV
jgi:hypothetical protein